ncbi:MAG: hypothetical protein HeimC3_39560 [Candidatus Heimdallarchaeota archaeon LC_3]|nr:MAG: hypothetical protein HeimC3_39560 [Candidatus Heimdallarchaeota archaeon LC_3]
MEQLLSSIDVAVFIEQIEDKFNWSWRSIEWLCQNLGSFEILDYQMNIEESKVKKNIKERLIKTVSKFKEETSMSEIDDTNLRKKLFQDLNDLKNRINQLIFHPKLADLLKSLSDLFNEIENYRIKQLLNYK